MSRSFVVWCVGAALLAPTLQLASLLVPFSSWNSFLIATGLAGWILVVSVDAAFGARAAKGREAPRAGRIPPRAVTAVAAVFLLSYAVNSLGCLPERLCVASSERALLDAARDIGVDRWSEVAFSPLRAWESTPERIGWLPVHRVVTSADGAAWFVLDQRLQFMGVDVDTVGLVHGPVDPCTPFGGKRFVAYDLGNGWHWFSVNDDWHC